MPDPAHDPRASRGKRHTRRMPNPRPRPTADDGGDADSPDELDSMLPDIDDLYGDSGSARDIETDVGDSDEPERGGGDDGDDGDDGELMEVEVEIAGPSEIDAPVPRPVPRGQREPIAPVAPGTASRPKRRGATEARTVPARQQPTARHQPQPDDSAPARRPEPSRRGPATISEADQPNPQPLRTRVDSSIGSGSESGPEDWSGSKLRSMERALGFGPLEKFEVGSPLGEGGIGAVKAAEDRALRRSLAIKYLHRPDDPRARARFVEEAQITGQLQHPNIVPVYELGVDAEGRPYMAMKRVHGRHFAEVIREAHRRANSSESIARRQLHRLLDVFLKVCDAMSYAHARGVIHRDLKPENVMVGEFGEVLVVDWGLAKPVEAGSDVATDAADDAVKPGESPGRMVSTRPPFAGKQRGSTTQISSDRRDDANHAVSVDGMVVGTLPYMPPEQAAGMSRNLDEGADIYALGAILYCILTNTPPFDAEDPELMAKVIRNDVELPSERASRSWTPRELEAVVLKAMARRRRDRYESVADLRLEIERYLEGATLEAADYTAWQRAMKWAGRNSAVVIGGATTLFVAVVSLVAIIMIQSNARQKELEREAELKEEKMRSLAREGQMEELRDYLGVELGERRNAAVEQFKKRFEDAEKEGKSQSQIFAEITPTEYEWYIARFQEAISASEQYGRTYHTPRDFNFLGLLVSAGRKDHDAAIEYYTKSIEIDPGFEQAWNNRALSRLQKATANLRGGAPVPPPIRQMILDAIADLDQAIKLEPDNPLGYSNRAAAWQYLDEFERALADVSRAVQIDPMYSDGWRNLGAVHLTMKNPKEAEAAYTKCIQLNPENALAYFQRGIARKDLGNYGGALEDMNAAIQRRNTEAFGRPATPYFERARLRQLSGSTWGAVEDLTIGVSVDPDNVPVRDLRARMYASIGNIEGARDDIRHIERLGEKPDPETKFHVGSAFMARGVQKAEKRGDLDGAILDFNEALPLLAGKVEAQADAYRLRALVYSNKEQNLPALNDINQSLQLTPDDAAALGVRGIIYARMEQWQKARADLERAIRIDPSNWELHRNLAVTLRAMNDLPAAVVSMREAVRRCPDPAERARLGQALAQLERDLGTDH